MVNCAMRYLKLPILLLLLSSATVTGWADVTATQEPGAQIVPPSVVTRKSVAGILYTDATGATLYTTDRDRPGKSSCDDVCANSWLAFAAAAIANPIGDWTVLDHSDGSRQWAFKGKPVYLFAGDQKPGETNGDGIDTVWHALFAARDFLPPNVTIRTIPYSDLGPALVTAEGRPLYLMAQFRWNPQGTRRHPAWYEHPDPGSCAEDCRNNWSPLKALPDVKAAGDWTTVQRDDGTLQWAWKGWPLYTYAKDKPGEAGGERMMTLQNGTTGLVWEVATLP